MDDISGSQNSLEPLSQETMNTLLFSLGGQSAISGLIGNEFERIQTSEDADGTNLTTGHDDAELRVSRTIIQAVPGSSSNMPSWPNSQVLSQGPPPPTTNGVQLTPSSLTSVSQTPMLIARQPTVTYHNGELEPESPLATTSHSVLTPPPSTSLTHTTPVTPTESTPGPSNPAASVMSRLPFAGDYGFEIDFGTDEKRVSKTANFTYSRLASRAFIKPKCPIPFTFSFRSPPPFDCVIRATPIYNSPELAGQYVYCCVADAHQMKENGQLFSSHFIRPHDNSGAIFYGDGSTQPSSVVVPFCHLTQTSATVWYTVYMFPCVTSHLRHKKHVEVMFTIELNGEVIGRCLVPIRVCTSPGRDRVLDEKKVSVSKEDEDETSSDSFQSRKRSADSVMEVTQYTLPPKRPCVRLSMPKVKYTIETHPELIPYIDVCVRMMEQVYSVPQPPPAAPTSEQLPTSKEMYGSVEEWLEHLGLGRYAKIFKEKGITRLFQVPNITDEELKRWGIKTATHRKKIIADKDNVIQLVKREESLSTQSSIEQDSGSPPLFASSPPNPAPLVHPPYMTRQFSRQLSQGSQQSGHSSQNSQLSNASAQFSQSFEVVQIQLKKKLSSSSSGSGSSQK